MTPLPTFYMVDGFRDRYLCFRTTVEPEGVLLSLVPDQEQQHPLDVVSIFLHDARLRAVDAEGELLESRARAPEAVSTHKEKAASIG